ncbi:hypothetical protein MJO28_004351, partial [Puccinia striiformis f. sp. tritici]
IDLPVCSKTTFKQLRQKEANHVELKSLQRNLNWTLRLEAQLQHLILQAQKPRANLNQMDDIMTAGLCPIHTTANFSIALNLVSIKQAISSLSSKRSHLYQASYLIPIRQAIANLSSPSPPSGLSTHILNLFLMYS